MTNATRDMRYIIESDSPDGGLSTYPECWGAGAVRGREMAQCASLREAIAEASAIATSGYPDSCTWIYDRLRRRIVPRTELRDAGGRFSVRYPGV